jgi:hypothetical protein
MRFLTHKWPRAVLLALVTSVVVAAPAAATGSKVIGHVYVNDNTVGANTIGAFDRHADGTLTAVSGSPFAAGGSGSGAGLASQGALQVTADGRYLLAVDAGSSQVSVLRIKPDGAVRLVRHGVVASGGLKPVSVADHDGLVYVANAGDGAPTTRASASLSAAICGRSPARRSRCPTARSPATSCSTQSERTSSGRASAAR